MGAVESMYKLQISHNHIEVLPNGNTLYTSNITNHHRHIQQLASYGEVYIYTTEYCDFTL